MYILCSCGLLFEKLAKGSRASRNPQKMKHFQQEGHNVVGIYTFQDNVPQPYVFARHHNKEEEVA